MPILRYEISDQSVGNILKRHGLERVPERRGETAAGISGSEWTKSDISYKINALCLFTSFPARSAARGSKAS